MTKRKRRPRRISRRRPRTTHPLLSAFINPDEPRVTGLVLDEEDRQLAVRSWELVSEGIAVSCECEKSDCEADGLLLRPELPHNIENQLLEEIQALRQEYGVPPDQVGFGTKVAGQHKLLPRFELGGQWKDERTIHAARAAFTATVMLAHPEEAKPLQPEDLPSPEEIRQRLAQAERFLDLAYGLLFFEGALRVDDLLDQVVAAGSFPSWVEDEDWLPALKQDDRFRVRGDTVYRPEVSDPDQVLIDKDARRLPPRDFTPAELLAAASGTLPLTAQEQRVDRLLKRHRSRWQSVRELQQDIRNVQRPTEVIGEWMRALEPRDVEEANRLLAPIMELWNFTPRYELRGRTPDEAARLGGWGWR